MSDLFHEEVPFSFIDQVIKTITVTLRHWYQLLTKRSARMAEYFERMPQPMRKNAPVV
jgi:protein gp37